MKNHHENGPIHWGFIFEVFLQHIQSRLYYRWFEVFFQENIKNVNLPLSYDGKKYVFNGNLSDMMRKYT